MIHRVASRRPAVRLPIVTSRTPEVKRLLPRVSGVLAGDGPATLRGVSREGWPRAEAINPSATRSDWQPRRETEHGGHQARPPTDCGTEIPERTQKPLTALQ